jgi:MFS family permease
VLHQYVPESPKWLLAFGDSRKTSTDSQFLTKSYGSSSSGVIQKANSTTRDQVYQQLKELRPEGHNIDREIEQMQEEIDQSKGKSETVSWADVFEYKQGVIIGCGLMFLQAMTGINSVIFYSTTIFGLAGFNEAIIGSCTVGIVNFVTTLVANRLIDKVGRKVLLNTGTCIMFVSLSVLAVVLLCPIDDKLQGWLAVLAILLYIVGFAIGLGAVVWVVMSEVMPTRVRSKAMSLFLNINWASNLVVGALTLTAIDSLGGAKDSMDDDAKGNAEKKGVAYIYIIFAAVCLVTLVFMAFYVPETKGTKPEEVKKPLLSKDMSEEELS